MKALPFKNFVNHLLISVGHHGNPLRLLILDIALCHNPYNLRPQVTVACQKRFYRKDIRTFIQA
jgi:hypothetical protein